MAKQEKNAGFQQSAGLIRYFDAEEETNIKFDPRVVLIVSFLLSVVVIVAQQLPQTRLS
jgi:preprotein translocase subunit Sec61beta